MNILFDQGTPVPLRRYLDPHSVRTVYEQGWSTVTNGALLALAEAHAFAVLITTDQNLRYQQNLAGRTIAIMVLRTTSWPRIQEQIALIRTVLETIQPGGYYEINIP